MRIALLVGLVVLASACGRVDEPLLDTEWDPTRAAPPPEKPFVPASAERIKMLYWLGDFYADRHKSAEAARTFKKVIDLAPGDPVAEDASWKMGWTAFQDRRFSETIRIFEDHLDLFPSGGRYQQVGYWLGRSREMTGQVEKATRDYRKVCRTSRHSFYCHNATARLTGLGDAETRPPMEGESDPAVGTADNPSHDDRTDPEADRDLKFFSDRHYKTARTLISLTLKQEAMAELEWLADRYKDHKTVRRLAELFYEAGGYHQSLKLVLLHFSDLINNGGDEVPAAFWRQAYPSHIAEKVSQDDSAGGVDPYLVAALIREESLYDSEAVSRSGAIGLMQLMPYTAEWVAKRAGLTHFSVDRLTDSETNVRLGVWYLGHLMKRFDGNPVLAVPAYNAGPEAVRRWVKNLKGKGLPMDEFVESIPFSETRYYTKRVLRSYGEYLRLSGNGPPPFSPELKVAP